MSGDKLTRIEREKLRQRGEILATAVKLFSEKGYHNVSMHEIAETAEFAVGTLYKFFKNKEDLYKSLMAEQCSTFHTALMKALKEGNDGVTKLRNYAQTKSRLFIDNAPIIRLYFAETSGVSFNIRTGLDSDVRKQYNNLMNNLASVFETGIKNKSFLKIAEPYHLALALDSLCNSFLFLWLESPELYPCPEDPDTILSILLKGLVNEQL